MNLEAFLAHVLEITGTFNLRIAIALYLVCTFGEIGFSIPYLLETVWLLVGYQLARGVLSPFDLFLIWLTAQAGRQTGAIALYYFSQYGSAPLLKLYRKYFERKVTGKHLIPAGIARRLTGLSPFSVAFGRLFGLRMPITFTLGVQKKWSVLLLGVVLSSAIWDGIYIALGNIVGIAVVPKPINMILYSLAGLTVLYVSTLTVRYLLHIRSSRTKVTGKIG
jgi:membrane-associated protein